MDASMGETGSADDSVDFLDPVDDSVDDLDPVDESGDDLDPVDESVDNEIVQNETVEDYLLDGDADDDTMDSEVLTSSTEDQPEGIEDDDVKSAGGNEAKTKDEEDEEDEEEDDNDDEDAPDDDDDEAEQLSPATSPGPGGTFSITENLSQAQKKYNLLVRRCEEIEQENQRIVEKILEVRTLVKTEESHREDLMRKLDTLGDTEYRNVPIVMPPAEEGKKRDRDPGATTSRPNRSRSKRTHETAETGEKKSKRARAQAHEGKDPHLPKRPQNPFFQFCQEQRHRVQKEYYRQNNVQLTKKELTKLMAQKWREMGSEQKQIYNILFEEEKQRYNETMYKYKETKKSLLASSKQ